MAAAAGAEPGSLGGSGVAIETHVNRERRGRRADRPAVDAGRGDGGDEAATSSSATIASGRTAKPASRRRHAGRMALAGALEDRLGAAPLLDLQASLYSAPSLTLL